MGNLKLTKIIEATGGEIISGAVSDFRGLSTDSRTIRQGELFVPLKGANFDGHDFLDAAMRLAGGALVSVRPDKVPAERSVVLVPDTLKALQDIARHIRNEMEVPVIGVTGTNGKTTTKEMIASILAKKNKVLKTTGNLNNHIGVPFSIANRSGDESVMVIEMGSNREGDIRLLCDIARPEYAVVTNVGPAHLEGFGSIETVRKTDLEILDYAGAVAVNADDIFLMEGLAGYRGNVVTFGIDHQADVYASHIVLSERGSSFRVFLRDGRNIGISLAVSGRFNVRNAVSAAAICSELGYTPEEIKCGLESFRGVPMRAEIREISGALVISDVYNANPASVEEALKELVRMKRKRTIAVLGDMLELGEYSAQAHTELLRKMNGLEIDILISTGPQMNAASPAFTGTSYAAEDSMSAGAILAGVLREGDTVLIKGSRGMKMEKVLEVFSERQNNAV